MQEMRRSVLLDLVDEFAVGWVKSDGLGRSLRLGVDVGYHPDDFGILRILLFI